MAAQFVPPLGSTLTSEATQIWSLPTTVQQLPALFIGDPQKSKMYLFNARGQLMKELNVRNWQVAVDNDDRLYVATLDIEPFITILSPPTYADRPSMIRLNHGFVAAGVAVEPRSGLLAVIARQTYGRSMVAFYRPGASTPCKIFWNTGDIQVFFGAAAFDGLGNLYLQTGSMNGNSLASISGGCDAKEVQPLSFAQTIQPGVNFGFNLNNDLVVENTDAPSGQIFTYPSPQNGVFPPPIMVTNLHSNQKYEPAFLGLTSDGEHLWGIEGGQVGLFAYPQGGSASITIHGVDASSSFAVFPPLIPNVPTAYGPAALLKMPM